MRLTQESIKNLVSWSLLTSKSVASVLILLPSTSSDHIHPGEHMKSWKTTTAGVVAGLGIIATQVSYLLDNDVLTTFSIEACFAALGIMGIGFFARDNKVTSETVGAK